MGDLVALRVRDVCHGDQLASRAIVMQHKTQRPVQFEITHKQSDGHASKSADARIDDRRHQPLAGGIRREDTAPPLLWPASHNGGGPLNAQRP